MNLYKKNRIWKKLRTMGMAFFVTGMVLGGGSAQGMVYAAESAYEQSDAVEETYEVLEKSKETEFAEDLEKNSVSNDRTDAANTEITDENAEPEADEERVPENEDAGNAEDSGFSDGSSEENENDGTEGEGGTDDSNNDENVAKKPDFALTVTAEEDRIKAGRDLVYTVTMENTGEVMLKNIQLHAVFSQDDLNGEWSGDDLKQLDVGMKKELYLTVKLPEGLDKAVMLHLSASAEVENEDGAESSSVMEETSLETEVIPLKASFEVTKTADRSVAVPGDKILFQICIRNTGERTLHSVITTERFLLGNVPVQFIEKEGVVLNKAKTKARIEKIEPGKAAGLEAMVTLPKDIKAQDLLNEVTVTTLETGDQTVASQAKIRVKAATETKEDSSDSVDKDSDSVDMDGGGAVSHTGESYPASTHPKTGDPYQPFLWLAMIPGSLLAAGWIRSRM